MWTVDGLVRCKGTQEHSVSKHSKRMGRTKTDRKLAWSGLHNGGCSGLHLSLGVD